MRRRNLLIDLTSLLDVILIILFLVLVTSAGQASASIGTLEAEKADLVSRLEQAEARELPGSDSEKNWYEVYQEQVGRVEVYFPDDLKTETMRLNLPDGEQRNKPESDDLDEWLTQAIESLDSTVVIVTFSYKNDAIYWRDYTGLRDLLLRLSTSSDKTIFYEEIPRK